VITGNILKEECVWFEKELEQLLKANKYKGGKLEIAYYPYSFNGRKICFGSNDKHHNHKEMLMQLIIADEKEEFLDFLINKAIPLFQNGVLIIPKYHF
jgi:hypothetical protein